MAVSASCSCYSETRTYVYRNQLRRSSRRRRCSNRRRIVRIARFARIVRPAAFAAKRYKLA